MNKWLMMMVCLGTLACGQEDKAEAADSGASADDQTTGDGTDDGGSGDDGSGDSGDGGDGGDGDSGSGDAGDSGEPTMPTEYVTAEDYVTAYCVGYAIRCGVYATATECIEDIMTRWYDDTCVVVNEEDTITCVDWLSELSCEVEGWIEECDDIIECD